MGRTEQRLEGKRRRRDADRTEKLSRSWFHEHWIGLVSTIALFSFAVAYVLALQLDSPELLDRGATAQPMSVTVRSEDAGKWKGWELDSDPTFGVADFGNRVHVQFALAVDRTSVSDTNGQPTLTLWLPGSTVNLSARGCRVVQNLNRASDSLRQVGCVVDPKTLQDKPFSNAPGGNIVVGFDISKSPYILGEGVGQESEAYAVSRWPEVEDSDKYEPFASVVESQKLDIKGNWGVSGGIQRFDMTPSPNGETSIVWLPRDTAHLDSSAPDPIFNTDGSYYWRMAPDSNDMVVDLHVTNAGTRRRYDLALFVLTFLMGAAISPGLSWVAGQVQNSRGLA